MNGNSRIVLVTGATRGIGRHIAGRLHADGYAVGFCARSPDAVRETEADLRRSAEAPVRGYIADVSDSDRVDDMVRDIESAWGAIDVLFNNAAVAGPIGPIENSASEDWALALQVNVLGAVNCCRSVLAAMRSRRAGRIVNVCGGGVGWNRLLPERSAYIASKFAIYGLTEALANEVRDCGITVNALSPGSIDTTLRRRLLGPEATETPPANLDKVVELAAFLASDRSGSLTGRIVSAQWDEIDALASLGTESASSSALTLRKIDGRNYRSV